MHEPGRGGGSAAAPLPAARLRSSSPSLLPGLPGPEVSEGAGQGGSVGIQNGMYSTPSILGVPFSASHPANLPQTHSEHPTKAQSLRESMWGRIQHRAAVPPCPAEDYFLLFFCPFGTWGCCLQCWRFVTCFPISLSYSWSWAPALILRADAWPSIPEDLLRSRYWDTGRAPHPSIHRQFSWSDVWLPLM